MKRIEKLFRSRDSDQKSAVDPELIRLIDQIEDHFGVRQVELISGFRSAAFNRKLKETGHQVARESLHIRGMAADIHLDEISEEALRDYALSLKAGGVGYYPNHNMVHVDVGAVRRWGEDYPRKAWVGEKTEVPVAITVWPDRSFKKRLDRLEAKPDSGSASLSLDPKWTVEFFEGGVWKQTGEFESLEEFNRLAPGLPYGKFRFRVQTRSGGHQYSNEFYFKRL